MFFLALLVISFGVATQAAILENERVIEAAFEEVEDMLIPSTEDLPDIVNSTNCGDLLVAGKGGYISYKLGQKYSNNERCIWTVRTPRWETRFLMYSSNFHSLNDYISLYVLGDDGKLELKGKIDSSTGNNFVGVFGPTIFLVFTSDHSGVGEGFFLEYIRFGYGETSGYTYTHSHLTKPSGTRQWPENPPEYYMNVYTTFTLNPQPNSKLLFSMENVDLNSLVTACQRNFLTVHQLFQDGFVLRLSYCEPDALTSATISSSSPLLITYGAGLKPQQTGIRFSWTESVGRA